MSKPFPYLQDPEGFLEEAARYEDAFLFVNLGGGIGGLGGPFLGYASESADVLSYDVWHGSDTGPALLDDYHRVTPLGFFSPLTDEEFDSLGFKAPVAPSQPDSTKQGA